MKSRVLIVFAVLLAFFAYSGFKASPKVKAPDFTLTDINGKKVSLSSFKGKVVYMDIWATWCGPCIYEMNHSKPLKNHFKNNKNVVFLYVSIDPDKDNWKSYVEKKEIHGVHLISVDGKEENIVNRYNVPSIPRFVLIDKDGNIADPDARRPSDSELIGDIESLLK